MFYFLEGESAMQVGTEEVEVAAGATVVVPTGASLGLRDVQAGVPEKPWRSGLGERTAPCPAVP